MSATTLKLIRLSRAVAGVLETFRRVPDEAILAMGVCDLGTCESGHCVCGQLARYVIAQKLGLRDISEVMNADADDDDAECFGGSPLVCQRAFGGTLREWYTVYYGVVTEVPWTDAPAYAFSISSNDYQPGGFMAPEMYSRATVNDVMDAFVLRLDEAVAGKRLYAVSRSVARA